jgi:hypothetical protein
VSGAELFTSSDGIPILSYAEANRELVASFVRYMESRGLSPRTIESCARSGTASADLRGHCEAGPHGTGALDRDPRNEAARRLECVTTKDGDVADSNRSRKRSRHRSQYPPQLACSRKDSTPSEEIVSRKMALVG